MPDNIESYIYDLRENYRFEINEDLEEILIQKYSAHQSSSHFDEELRQSAFVDIQIYHSSEIEEWKRNVSNDFDRLTSELNSLQEQHERAMSLINKLGLDKFLFCLNETGDLPEDFDPF